MSANPSNLQRQEGLFRFIHPNNANPDGTVTSGAFSLRRDNEVSLGIESIIRTVSFDRFCNIKPEQGVARIEVGDVLDLGLSVTPEPEPTWGDFADAHALLGGYLDWSKRKKDDYARLLRDLANRNIVKEVPKKVD